MRAVEHGNVLVAEATLRAEIPSPTLGDLLELTALIAQKQPEWFSRVAARWLLKYLRAVDVWRAVAHALRGGVPSPATSSGHTTAGRQPRT